LLPKPLMCSRDKFSENRNVVKDVSQKLTSVSLHSKSCLNKIANIKILSANSKHKS